MRKKTDFSIRQAILLFLFTMWCTSLAVTSAEEVSWIHGETPPDGWEIYPPNPTTEDVIYFSHSFKDDEIYDNSCLAEQAFGGTPIITYGEFPPSEGKVEIEFEPPAPESCTTEYDPVCGFQGSFGPINEIGEWALMVNWGGVVQWIEFYVAPIYYVDDDATGAGDGSSWADAFVYLQNALSEAQSYGNPAEIRVAQGVYNPDSNSANPSGTGDREATFQLISGVTIEGGYAGFGAPDPNAREIEQYKTILSGDLNSDDEPNNFVNYGDNSYHVVNVSCQVVLDGLTITAGNANGSAPNNNGAGLYIDNEYASPTIRNCTISGNRTDGDGGGMYNYQGSPTVTACTFTGNSAGNNGGGLYNNDHSDPKLINCTISDNAAGNNGGGIYCDYYSVPALTNCIINDNSAGNDGGGVYNYDRSDATLTNCTVSGNTADNDGGGAYNTYSDMILNNCLIHNNTAGDDGGGVGNMGTLMITNSMMSGNSAIEYGGAVYNWECTSTLTNCTFTNNSASIGNALVYDSGFGNHQVTNCILWDGGGEIWHNASLVIPVTYSDVQGGWEGDGNIDSDPNFVDPDGPDNDPNTWQDNDYHLQWISPCINTGALNYIPGEEYLDIDGEPRVMAGRIDIGADEVGPKQADFTREGIIDIKDFAIFGQSWLTSKGQESWYILSDLHKDNQIDLEDLAIFFDDWLWQASWFDSTSTAQIVWNVSEECASESTQESGPIEMLEESEDLRFSVTVEGSYIHFEDMMVANCYPDELGLEMTVENNLITIHETEYTPEGTWCICSFPVTATLGPFATGIYALEIYEDWSGFIGTTVVSIE